jgi:2-hydroxychromene-2-carboxylate isomerase
MQAAFVACSERAIAVGVPGSLTYIVDGEIFYGQDRLMMVERAHVDAGVGHTARCKPLFVLLPGH